MPLRVGMSLTGLTMTEILSVKVSVAPPPLSFTVTVMFCDVELFALAMVLYFKPCMSAWFKPVVVVKTWVTPSAFHKVTVGGILLML